jgi:hypothetical protein
MALISGVMPRRSRTRSRLYPLILAWSSLSTSDVDVKPGPIFVTLRPWKRTLSA